jgi:hypothetical protein
VTQIQQSVLGDEHPVVGSTMDSIEFVENSKEGAEAASISSGPRSPSWEISKEASGQIMCRAGQAGIDEVLGMNAMFSNLSPNDWFQRMEHAFTENTCGGGQMTTATTRDEDDDAPTETDSVTASDTMPPGNAESMSQYSV